MLDTAIERVIAIGFVIVIILFIIQLIIFGRQASQFAKTETAIDTTSKNLNTTSSNIDGMIAKANPVIDQVGTLTNKISPFLDWGIGAAETYVCGLTLPASTPKPAFCNTPDLPLVIPTHSITPAHHTTPTYNDLYEQYY